VPMFVSSQNIPLIPHASDELVSLEDICPTILDMAGVDIPAQVDGRSLLPVIQQKVPSLDRHVLYGEHSGEHGNHWVIKDRVKYIWYAPTHEEQLFDLAVDPGETKDLSADAARLQPFRQLLATRLENREDYTYDSGKLEPCANRQPAVFWPSRA